MARGCLSASQSHAFVAVPDGKPVSIFLGTAVSCVGPIGKLKQRRSFVKQAVGQRALQNARARKQLKKDADSILASARALHDAGQHAEVQALC